MSERRMDMGTAALAREKAQHAKVLLEQWEHEHPNVVDYRVTDAMGGLRLAVRALGHLYRDDHYPEHTEALRALRKSLEE